MTCIYKKLADKMDKKWGAGHQHREELMDNWKRAERKEDLQKIEPLKDLRYFGMFKVNRDIDTIVWPNNADFSPDFLYKIGEPISEQTYQADNAER